MRKEVKIDDAVRLLLQCAIAPGKEVVPATDALGRVLFSDITAEVELPPFHRSAYDGYAFRAEDTRFASEEKPLLFPVANEICAGMPGGTLPAGWAVKIMTGAELPGGADCVINNERISHETKGIRIDFSMSPWQNVDRRGAEAKTGDLLLKQGRRLGPAELAVLASQGITSIPVYRKPRVSILSLGSELSPAGKPLTQGKIYDSNLSFLKGQMQSNGFEVAGCTCLEDNPGLISRKMKESCTTSELLITSGGASVGDRDYAGNALKAIEAEILFSRVCMKPGANCYGARKKDTLIVCLSGNPGALMAEFFCVVFPAARKLAGWQNPYLQEAILPVCRNRRKTDIVPRIIPGHIDYQEGTAVFIAHEGDKSSMRMSWVGADAFAEISPGEVFSEDREMARVRFLERVR